MTRRIIVTVEEGVDPVRALRCAAHVVELGRISADGRRYCWVSTFSDGIVVLTRERGKGDSFIVRRENGGTCSE